ncbi:hypothetical protein ACMAY7_09830 [Rhodobacteraceae bacterium nBUS_24]|jgi:hypothetical protein|nr:hypothetical protein [Marinovum sp.]MBT4871083.1 hypothetical protein [Marinovum sp.]MBT6098019.1 hypothetical protein [Marinovum sp.]MBT7906686.1 hypothetical protein [Marinovum sp.]
MNSFNVYQFTAFQAQLLTELLAQRFLTELKRAANKKPEEDRRCRTIANPEPAVVVELSDKARELLEYKKAPYL